MSTTERTPAPTGRKAVETAARSAGPEPGSQPSHQAGLWAMALLRIATGFVFLWAFLDKTFGLGYSTASANAWTHGGSPTKGFLSHLDAGPFRGMLTDWAGQPFVDWLFMLGLLGIGVAVMAGVALRISAVAGSIMMVAMWVAEWPLAKVGVSGDATGSTNPLVDYHIIYALALVACAATGAGVKWGLGRIWQQVEIVDQHRRWLV